MLRNESAETDVISTSFLHCDFLIHGVSTVNDLSPILSFLVGAGHMFYVLQAKATGGSSDIVMRTTEAQDCWQKHKKVCVRSC